jgi:hypothetical protein
MRKQQSTLNQTTFQWNALEHTKSPLITRNTREVARHRYGEARS